MAKRKQIQEWRDDHFKEMENNLKVWMSIRDDVGASNKDRIEAGKCIARALGALAPDRVSTTKPKESQADQVLTPEEEAMVSRILGGLPS